MKYQNQASEKILTEIFAIQSPSETLETISMIRQLNMDLFPDNGNAGNLKQQQYLLEYLEYFFKSLNQEATGSS